MVTLPMASLEARARSVVSKKTSTLCRGVEAAACTVTDAPGGPLAGESDGALGPRRPVRPRRRSTAARRQCTPR